MIHDRIAKLEATLAATPDLPAATREELLALLADLKAEVATLSETNLEEAGSATRPADAGTVADRDSAPAVLDELRASVEGFEASHPKLVQVVDRIAVTLSNMGI